MNTGDYLFILFMAFVFGLVLGFWGGMHAIKNKALRKGYAEYSQTTGDWQWKTNLIKTPNLEGK